MGKGAYLGISSFIALVMCALYASTGMAQELSPAQAGDLEGVIDTGDNAWILTSSALVLIMTPGLALFYGGMAGAKNMANTLWMCFIVICVVSVQWVLWGYTLSFGEGNWFIGGFDWVALQGVGQEPTEGSTLPHLTFMIFQCMFAIITLALVSGAIVERMKFTAWLLLIPLWTTVVYAPICHWVWGPGGWLGSFGALDFAGGTVVHITSGASALVLCLFLGVRKGYPKSVRPPHNIPFTLLGASLLWFGWFGFNAGSELAADGLAASAFVVTNTATACAGFTWAMLDWAHSGKPTLVGTCSGAVAGLVAITPASGFVGPMGSIAVGVGAGLVCYYASVYLKRALGYDDALDVVGIHAFGGTWGAFATGLFAQLSVNPGGADGAIYGNPYQLIPQSVGIAASWAWACGITAILALIIKYTVGLKASSADEQAGMDITQHKEIAYTHET
ncbi:MAG: ammonium transporter [Candidatus Brocadiales bacterium]|nr:ammonium transporter [Candidatus Bathyanammoxibius amoris]